VGSTFRLTAIPYTRGKHSHDANCFPSERWRRNRRTSPRLADPQQRRQIGMKRSVAWLRVGDGIEIRRWLGTERISRGSQPGRDSRSTHTPPVEAMLDLLVEERGDVNMLEINQSEENLREALCHPLSNVISDGSM